MKVYLVIADSIPVLQFATADEAQRICELRPDLQWREADLPDGSKLPGRPTESAREAEGSCQNPQCPGMMAYGLIGLR